MLRILVADDNKIMESDFSFKVDLKKKSDVMFLCKKPNRFHSSASRSQSPFVQFLFTIQRIIYFPFRTGS